MQSSPTARLAATARHFVPRAADRVADAERERPASLVPASALSQGASGQAVLPLPPATTSGPPGDIQPVPDDEPTVDDLAGREAPAT